MQLSERPQSRFSSCCTALLFISSACAAAEGVEGESAAVKEFIKQVGPGKVVEECMQLESGQTLGYEFSSEQAMRFNLHYHEESSGDVVYAEGPALAKRQPPEELYLAPASNLMCLMWENESATEITLEYSYWLLPIGI